MRLKYWDQKNQSDLKIWCTPGNTKNHTRVLINILYPTQCHEFHLIWCDISKSHCEEDPSNYAGLKRGTIVEDGKDFCPKDKIISHGSADIGTFRLVFYV